MHLYLTFQLTRPARGEPRFLRIAHRHIIISTHSPRTGRTKAERAGNRRFFDFNSLATRGANPSVSALCALRASFQLTRSTRGEPQHAYATAVACFISTHSPTSPIPAAIFQLTRPVRGEPVIYALCATRFVISTHSPRVGRTLRFYILLKSPKNFNSLAPRGANPVGFRLFANDSAFQLTRPARGEPIRRYVHIFAYDISTHSPRTGRTYPAQGLSKI